MKPKILILQETLSSYNVPVYCIIAQSMDLTVAFTLKNEFKEELPFKTIQLGYLKIGGLYFMHKYFYEICSQHDAVIFLPDLHYFSYCSLPFIHRKYKVIPWTIGIRASYKRRYDIARKKDFIDKIYGKILNKSDAIIFYMKAPLKFWGNSIDKEKVFIAHNTVDVIHNELVNNKDKNTILFIGTLYKEKKIYELIDAYIEARSKCINNKFLYLNIIGEGEEFENIKSIIKAKRLGDSILLYGAIFDEKEIAQHFAKSILCISPDQAGLSVLKSMGYGVPFVTRTNAITGGELLNITNKKNGILYNSKNELVTIIEDAFHNPQKYLDMGINAKKYYQSTATPKLMAQGHIDAINYVLKLHL